MENCTNLFAWQKLLLFENNSSPSWPSSKQLLRTLRNMNAIYVLLTAYLQVLEAQTGKNAGAKVAKVDNICAAFVPTYCTSFVCIKSHKSHDVPFNELHRAHLS